MFGKAFGKRTQAAQPAPDRDGTTRVIPQAVWQGKHGAFLRELGMSPDDASNVVASRDQLQARYDRSLDEEKTYVARWNEQLPCQVAAWQMIPRDCWRGANADFLMSTLDVFPAAAWNLLLLPIDERGAMTLNLPRHPMRTDPDHVAAADRLIGEVSQKVKAMHAEATAKADRGDNSAMFGYSRVLDEARADLAGVAFWFGARILGDAALKRSRELFFGGK